MPVNYSNPLRKYQWGVEATKGTAVPATSGILAEAIDFDDDDEIERPDLATGIGYEVKGSEFAIRRGTKFTVPDFPISFEQLPHWLRMAVKGAVTPTGVGPYIWTFTPALGADPDLDARTLERRITDGANNLDDEWAYAMLSRFTLKWEAGMSSMKASAEGFARRRQNSTFTAAQTYPTPEHIPGALMTVFIDSTFAGLGGTQVTGQVLSGELEINTGYKPYWASDGRTDLDHSSHEWDARARTYSLKMRIVARNSGQLAAERTAAEALTLRAVRLRATGTSSRILTLDGLYKHEKGTSLVKVGEVDGQEVVDVTLRQSTDGTNAQSIVCQNNLAAIN